MEIERPQEPEEVPEGEIQPRRGAAWTALLYAGPLFLLLVWVSLPLARGLETLYLRDVLNTHLEMKWAQTEAMRAGYFPLIDPYRAGGQPLAGNPNAVPFYPTNLLFLIGPPIWALNAHFWIHLLLAPLAFYWMARSWGLAREPAWAAAACYAVSGFFLSHMSFYNLIAGAALAPALVAACLDFHRPDRTRRGWMAPIIAVLWGLLLLGGDPLMALLALALAGAAILPSWLRRGELPGWSGVALFAASFAVGTMLALPQLVEFQRILPISFRGHWGYSERVATVASWDPRQIAEWLIPFLFGRLDLMSYGSFWGSKYFTDVPPYYPSLYPGLLALALVAASGRPRNRAAWWAWVLAAAGLFFSLGRFNPLVHWLFSVGGKGSLRYPVKFWLPVAVGGALLCGLGFERLLRPRLESLRNGARLRFRLALIVLGSALGGLWIFLSFFPAASEVWIRRIIPDSQTDLFVTNERLRWAGLCLLSLVLLAVLAVLFRLSRRRAVAAGALLLAAHALAQILFLQPLYPMDPVVPYEVEPPALEHLPRNLTAVNPDFNYLFGPTNLKSGKFPSPSSMWIERRAFYELYPFTGPMWGRRYELNTSPEGLDTFLTRMAQQSVKRAKDEERVRLLAAWGVGRLLLTRRLDPEPAGVRRLATLPSFSKELHIYDIVSRAPEVLLAKRVLQAPHLNAAYAWMIRPDFDPRIDVVLPGDGPSRQYGGGTARIVRRSPEALEIETDAGAGGSVLLIQRAYHLYRATVDGRRTPVLTANLHRIGIEVPAGRHRVRIWIDRTRFQRSLVAVAVGFLLLPLLAWWGRRDRKVERKAEIRE